MMKLIQVSFVGATLMRIMLPGDACAQQYLSPGYILSEIQQGMGFYKVPQAPDFVQKARPDPSTIDYEPLKPAPRNFHSDVNKPASLLEAKAPEIAELEAARAKNQARARSSGGAPSRQIAPAVEAPPPVMTWSPLDTD